MAFPDRSKGCLLGLAVGDAVGTTVEFRRRGSFEPLTDMIGGGPFRLQAGQWTDDTSMALCLAASLLECKGFDALDQMERYCRWRDDGYMSCTGTCFDIGNTVRSALDRFQDTGEPFAGSTDPWSAGNGCIMRLAPVPMFYAADPQQAEHFSMESSRTTHGTQQCLDACRLMGRILWRALNGLEKEDVALGDRHTFIGTEKIVAIARGEYRQKTESEIRGTGYVVDCLEAALWCFTHSSNYREAVLMAANLGDDADTTAAVCGQIAGAFYGASGIPQPWLHKLAMREEIEALAQKLYSRASKRLE